MVKYNFDPSQPVIVLYVEIEGTKIARPKMALDTRATYLMIPWEIVESLGYRPELSKESVDMITVSGIEKVPLITLDSVSVLSKKVKNVKAIVHDLPPRSYVDGLLGLSFLKNFRISLDFREGIMGIE